MFVLEGQHAETLDCTRVLRFELHLDFSLVHPRHKSVFERAMQERFRERGVVHEVQGRQLDCYSLVAFFEISN